MGVRGLTTFIKNEEKKYLRKHKLHDCTVLLDGNSIASNLYNWSKVDSAFGGDYDKFAKYVKEFFKILQKCNIKPLVLFDGGYEQRKLKTVYSRLKDKLQATQDIRPFSTSCTFPLFMRLVFREVLTELKIPFAQSDFEADDELAALARFLQCPIISYDSDFYIYDVLYIPFPMIDLQPVAFKNSATETNGTKYYLDCKIYHVEVFVNSFGGLDKNMLPLLAALLGNDYIKISSFKNFYANLKIPKGKTKPTQRRIRAIIEWLRKETFDSAINKILDRMKKHSRKRLLRQMKKIVNGYTQCSSILINYLGVDGEIFAVEEECEASIVKILKNIENNEESSIIEVDQNSDSECPSESSDDDRCESEDQGEDNLECHQEFLNIPEETDTDFPTWLLDYARRGKIQPCVMDILSLNQYFFSPQVEDFTFPSSHQISLKILSAIVGILLGETETLVRYWIRESTRLEWYTVEPIFESVNFKFPSCTNILDIDESVRRSILLEITEANIDLKFLPEEWHLFVIAILYWLKNMEQPATTECHMHTLVMCLVAVYVLDSKIGMHRNKQSFNKKYKNYLSKLIETRKKTVKASKDLKPENSSMLQNNLEEVRDLNEVLLSVSHDDCVIMFEKILPYHHLSERIKVRPKLFSIETVHAFAQFQSCLFHLIVFNSVLGLPLQEVFVNRFYSGTFVYNMFTDLSKRTNIESYLEGVFQAAPTLLSLYKAIVNLLKSSLIAIDFHKNLPRTNRKKKKSSKRPEPDLVQKLEDDSEEEGFFDENNTFSRLSCMSNS